jgi:hypothetical protein
MKCSELLLESSRLDDEEVEGTDIRLCHHTGGAIKDLAVSEMSEVTVLLKQVMSCSMLQNH